MKWFGRFICGLKGHMPVTRRYGQRLQVQCFICDKAIGGGMDFTGFRGPRVAVGKPKSMREWRQKHGTRKAS